MQIWSYLLFERFSFYKSFKENKMKYEFYVTNLNFAGGDLYQFIDKKMGFLFFQILENHSQKCCVAKETFFLIGHWGVDFAEIESECKGR